MGPPPGSFIPGVGPPPQLMGAPPGHMVMAGPPPGAVIMGGPPPGHPGGPPPGGYSENQE